MALADATIAVAGAAHVVIVTIDHGLVATSALVADGVATWAKAQGAAAVVRRVEVAARARGAPGPSGRGTGPGGSGGWGAGGLGGARSSRSSRGLEAAARAARYAALDQAMRRARPGRDADRAHRIAIRPRPCLMRIVRGTGPAGLAGMPARRGPFVRPLLGLTRADDRGVRPGASLAGLGRPDEPRSGGHPGPGPGRRHAGGAVGEPVGRRRAGPARGERPASGST